MLHSYFTNYSSYDNGLGGSGGCGSCAGGSQPSVINYPDGRIETRIYDLNGKLLKSIINNHLVTRQTTAYAYDASHGGVRYQSLFMLGVVLLIFTGALNVTAQYIIRRSR